jgi:uncharacterized protein involved in exopolysaccharide biosynthesis
MSTTVGLPSNVVIRDLLLTLWFSRRRILLIMIAAMALAAYVAFQVDPKYQSKASFLVLLGSEYGMRPVGGQQLISNINAAPEELLHTEADILYSTDLHRDVIEQIGVAKLYPDLLKPPGPFAQFVKQARSSVYDLLGLQDGRPPADGTEALVQAEKQFAQNFGVSVDRKSHIIQVFFQHPNAVLAADALKVLEARYFVLRAKLFADKQLAIVEGDQNRAGAQLAAADAKLADFKRVHDVANFAERQKILMTGQGALEDQLSKAESATAGLQARLDGLTVQLKIASGQPNGKGNPNAAGALQGMVQAYQKRQNEALTTYRGSPAYDTARTEMLKAQEEIAKMRSTQAFTVQQEYNKTEADLRTSQATRDAIRVQLKNIAGDLASINADEAQLHELERTRGVLEDNYRAIAKVATDRQVIEDVDAKRQPSVRVVETPRVPDKPQPIRLVILAVGAIAGLLLSIIVSLMSGFFRGVYLRPEALELDTGLAVLAVVPDQRSLASPVVLVTPR